MGSFCFGNLGVVGIHFGIVGKVAPFGRKFYILLSAHIFDRNIFLTTAVPPRRFFHQSG